MSDNNNIIWDDLVPTFEQTQENYFDNWNKFEQIFGNLGTPGFSEQIRSIKAPYIFGHQNSVDVRFTLYYNESGKLVFVHGCYIDENGVQKTLTLNAHPDYQRQGLGTMMANYVIERYKNENNSDFSYEQSFRGVKHNTATANFANKYVKNVRKK